METVEPNMAWLETAAPNQLPTAAAPPPPEAAGARVPYRKPIISQELQSEFAQKTEEHQHHQGELAALIQRLKDANETLARHQAQWEAAGRPATTKIEVEEAQVRFKSAKKNLQSNHWAILTMRVRRVYLECAQSARRWTEKSNQPWFVWALGCAVVFFGLLLVAAVAMSFRVSPVLLVGAMGFAGGFALVPTLLFVPSATSMAKRVASLDREILGRKTNKELAAREETRQHYERVLGRFDVLAVYETSMASVKELEARQGELVQLEHARRLECEELKERLSLRYQLRKLNWRSLEDVEFEEFLRDVFQELGFHVEMMGATRRTIGDQGADLIITRFDLRIVVQAKGSPTQQTIDGAAVREAHTAMAVFKCSRSIAITNSKFTGPARDLAQGCNCMLIDGDMMEALIDGEIEIN